MIDRDIKEKRLKQEHRTQLYNDSKLKKEKMLTADVLDKICCQLECQLNDIAEIIPDKEEH